MNKIKIQINKSIHGYKAGDIININVNDKNIPDNKLWRRRLKDSEIDNCVTVIVENKQEKIEKNQKKV